TSLRRVSACLTPDVGEYVQRYFFCPRSIPNNPVSQAENHSAGLVVQFCEGGMVPVGNLRNKCRETLFVILTVMTGLRWRGFHDLHHNILLRRPQPDWIIHFQMIFRQSSFVTSVSMDLPLGRMPIP